MAKTKIRVNSAGVVALLKSAAVQADLASRANAIDSALPRDAGEEWKVSTLVGRDRAHAFVKTDNTAARRTAAESTSVQAALGAGR